MPKSGTIGESFRPYEVKKAETVVKPFNSDEHRNPETVSAPSSASNPYTQSQPGSFFTLKSNVTTVLALQSDEDWILNLNIGNVM